MGITHILKTMALATTVLLLGLAVAACGGTTSSSSSSSFTHLIPQRANVVGSVDVDKLLDLMGADLEELFGSLGSGSLSGSEDFSELFSSDLDGVAGLFSSVSWVDIFAEADVDGESEYFVVVLHGSFDDTSVIAELEAISGRALQRESYKGSIVYTLDEDGDEFALAVLESALFAIGSVEGVKDYINLTEGDAESASGAMIDVFQDLSDGIFALAASVPQDAFDGEDLGSVPGLGDLPISLDFLSSLDIIGLGGELNGDILDLAVTLYFTDAEAAETLEGFIDGFVTLASGFSPDPRTTELLSGLEINRDGTRLTITIGIPESEISSMFDDLTSIDSSTQSGSGSFSVATPEYRLIEPVIAQEVAIMPSADHVPEGQTVSYSTLPPTSGPHWPQWADCGWYPDGLPDERTTHNLEHGNIVVSYNLTDRAEVSALRAALDSIDEFQDWGVARSYNGIPEGQVSLSAWGRLITFEGVEAEQIEEFAGQLGPERVPC